MADAPEPLGGAVRVDGRGTEPRIGRRLLRDSAGSAFLLSLFAMAVDDEDDDGDLADLADDALAAGEYFTSLLLQAQLGSITRFNINRFSSLHCYVQFRFHLADVHRVVEALRLPPVMRCTSNGTVFSAVEGFAILTRLLSYPIRLVDARDFFHRPEDEVSHIFNEMLRWMRKHWLSILLGPCITRASAEAQRAAIRAKAQIPTLSVFAFIDGTARPIRRPGRNQRIVYNGHKHMHALKYLAVQTPDGLLPCLFGAWEGCRHDAAQLQESGLLDVLEQVLPPVAGDDLPDLTLYGDSGFPQSRRLLVPFRRLGITFQRAQFNRVMSSLRVSVEWGIGHLTRLWRTLSFVDGQVLGQRPVGLHYLVAGFLTNIHVCLYSSQTSLYFNCTPPSLQDYLSTPHPIIEDE